MGVLQVGTSETKQKAPLKGKKERITGVKRRGKVNKGSISGVRGQGWRWRLTGAWGVGGNW